MVLAEVGDRVGEGGIVMTGNDISIRDEAGREIRGKRRGKEERRIEQE